MKKIIIAAFTVCVFFYSGNTAYAQQTTVKSNADAAPTPKNVLARAKEVLPKMEQLSEKLAKLKPDNERDKDAKKNYLKALQSLRDINRKGMKLTAAEAQQYDAWFKGVVNTFYIDCQSHNGNVCCVDCHNHGILGIWCYANCFVASFPLPD